MTHRLFLLRDDHLFVRVLGYCWFVDTDRKMMKGDYHETSRNIHAVQALQQAVQEAAGTN